MTIFKAGPLRDALEAKESALEELLQRREGISVERIPDASDEAQCSLQRDLQIGTLDRESGLLAAIRFALQRMDDGTYGVCQSCDNEISEKRLAAVPWAMYCIHCQESIDRESQMKYRELLPQHQLSHY